MTITRANCDCLNSNYLPSDIRQLIITHDDGWVYSKGKFSLILEYCHETLEQTRNFAKVLKQFSIHPTLLTIHSEKQHFNFSIYEDDIHRAVYEQRTTQAILEALEDAFNKKRHSHTMQ